MRRVLIGMGLQAISFLIGHFCNQLPYGAGWAGTLFLVIPIYVIAIIVVLTADAALWARLLLILVPLALTFWSNSDDLTVH